MEKKTVVFAITLIAILFFGAEMKIVHADKGPLSKKQLDSYSEIVFKLENFHKVEGGWTRESVLSLLGKPDRVKKEKRRSNRWTVHYFYPEGHVVNFKDGLVVGKE